MYTISQDEDHWWRITNSDSRRMWSTKFASKEVAEGLLKNMGHWYDRVLNSTNNIKELYAMQIIYGDPPLLKRNQRISKRSYKKIY